MKNLLRRIVKAPMFLMLSVIMVLSAMSACILSINAAEPLADTNRYKVVFPTYTDAIEKLEYSIGTIGMDGAPNKSEWVWSDWKDVDGKLSAEVTNKNKIKFLVKFKDGYSDLYVNSIKIKSDAKGEDNTSGLMIYQKAKNDEIVLCTPTGSEKINKETSYSSEEITINQDQTLYFDGIRPNLYSIKLNIPMSEEIFDVYYSVNNETTSQKEATKIPAKRNENNYVYELDYFPHGSVANFEMRLKDKYSQLSAQNFDIFPTEPNNSFLKTSGTSLTFSWEAKENAEINFNVTDKVEIKPNTYDIKNTTGKTLYCNDNSSEESEKILNPGETVTATHGAVYNFYTQSNDDLMYDNNISMSKTNQDEKTEYYISNITKNHNISVQENPTDGFTTITLPNKNGVHFVDKNDAEFEDKDYEDSNSKEKLKVAKNANFEFKLKEVEGYKKDFKNIKLYKVSENATSYTENDILTPDENDIYSLAVENGPIKILVGNDAPNIDKYTMTVAKQLLANSYLTMTVTKTEIINGNQTETRLEPQNDKDNLYNLYSDIEYGSSLKIKISTSSEKFDLTDLKMTDELKNSEPKNISKGKEESDWEISSVTGDMLVGISDISRKLSSVSFDKNGTDGLEIDFVNSMYEDDNGEIQKLNPTTVDTLPGFKVPTDSTVHLKFRYSYEERIKLNIEGNDKIILPNDDGYFVIKIEGDHVKLVECGISTFPITVSSNLTDLKISEGENPPKDDREYKRFGKENTSYTFDVKRGTTFSIYAVRDNSQENPPLTARDTDTGFIREDNKVDDNTANKLILPEHELSGTYRINNVQTDKSIMFYDPNAEGVKPPIETGGTQLVSARNMAPKYTLVKSNDLNDDYDVNFKEYPTDMHEKLGIKSPSGKVYNMCYHVISEINDKFPTKDKYGGTKTEEDKKNANSACDKYINDNGGEENLAGCDVFYRYEAPTKLNIKLDYGKNCNADNFVGFQFDAVRQDDDNTVVSDIFKLTPELEMLIKYRENSGYQFLRSMDELYSYSKKYKNTYGGVKRGLLSDYVNDDFYITDSLRGLFAIHWLPKTLSIAKNMEDLDKGGYGNYSIFNTRHFKYTTTNSDSPQNTPLEYYSLLTRIDDLNYVAKDRTFYFGGNPSALQLSNTKLLLYDNKKTSEDTGSVPYREYFRCSPTISRDGLTDTAFEKKLENLNGKPYKLELESSGDDKKIVSATLEGKNTTEPDKVSSGNIDLNIKTKTLLVFENNRENRYEDDIILKGDYNYCQKFAQDARKYMLTRVQHGQYYCSDSDCQLFGLGYDGVSVGSEDGNYKEKSSLSPVYSKDTKGMFDIYALNAYKEIRITPVFDKKGQLTPTGADNPKLTFPEKEIPGIKFYSCTKDEISGEDVPGVEISANKIITKGTDDSNNWYKDPSNQNAWSYKFIIKPDEAYNFIPGTVKVTPEGYSTLSYEEKTDSVNGKYYIFYVKNMMRDNNTLVVPEVQKYKYTITCNKGYTNFYDDTDIQFLTKELTFGDNFTFSTEATDGYLHNEVLIINTENDSFKIAEDSKVVTLTNGTKIERSTEKSTETKNVYIVTGIKEDFSVFSTRERKSVPLTLVYSDNIYYKDTNGRYITMKTEGDEKHVYYTTDPSEVTKDDVDLSVGYGSSFYFTIEEREGFDPLSTIVTANNVKLDYENGKYLIRNITYATIVKIESTEQINYKAYFTDHEGVTFKSVDGKNLPSENTVAYGSSLTFKISISEAYSSSSNYKVMVEYSTEGKEPTEILKDENSDRYTIENIQEDIRIYVDGLEHNKYSMKLYNTTGISYYDKYGQEKYIPNGDFVEKEAYHGEDFSFKIVADEGYDISQIKVYVKPEKSTLRKQLLPSNDVYTIENTTDNYIVTVENTKKTTYNVEIRSTVGAKCLDSNGNLLNSNLTVSHGDNLDFTIALDKAYNRSTPIVTLKGSLNVISPIDGKYTISNITENKIVEITGVKKNTYKATFKEAEGVIYKNGKNKPFSGSLDAEDGETLNFKITLMDAYDKSTPLVLLNNSKSITESGGVYSIGNVSSDLEISVENVFKNPEEVTMEDVNNVPDKVSTELDISRVVTASRTYLNLSDEEKAQVINLADLKRAQEEAGVINHKAGDISVTGLDWNIKVVVDKLTNDAEKINYMNEKIDRRQVIYLYDIYLIDLLTDEIYELPYGNKVTVTMPAPDLSGYKNEVIVHEKSNGNIEYIDMNITDGTARFEATSFSLFGIAAKKIPNYSDPSSTKIYVSDLVDNEDELQALLGEGVNSQLGDLTKDKNEINLFGDEDILSEEKSILEKIYQWILNHELLSVIIILIIGSLLIFLILLRAKKEDSNKN